MKYRVVGWTNYDDPSVGDGPATEAACNAIIDEIKRCDYLFTGWHHQESLYGAPVLNDGLRRCFSQRGFGAVMAEAQGLTGLFSYSTYAFLWDNNETNYRLPNTGFHPSTFRPETDLNEEFTIPFTEDLRFDADTGILRLPNDPALRYIDKGDTLRILKGDTAALFTVLQVDRAPDFDEDELNRLMGIAHLSHGSEHDAAKEKLESAPICLILSVESKL